MKTIIAYRSIIEDTWRWIINYKLMFKYQYPCSHLHKKVTKILVDIFITWQTNSKEKKQN